MSLVKWSVGFLAFQILVVVLLVSLAPMFSDASYTDEGMSDPSWNSSSTIDVNSLGIFSKFTYSVSSIPFPWNIVIFFPTAISGVLFIAWLRGVE